MDPFENTEITIHQTQDNDACPPILPIFSIPSEITMLIFSFACHPSPIICQNRRSGIKAEELSHFAREEGQELTISHVCRAWRSISHADPALWSTFHYFSKYDRQHFTARHHAYLERAQSNLLTLWVCFSTAEDVTIILGMLRCTNNSRWRKISLAFDRHYTLGRESEIGWVPQQHSPDADSPHRFNYSNLETLDIGCSRGHGYLLWMNTDIVRMISDVASTPRLVALRMDAAVNIPQPNFGKVCRASLSVLQLHGLGQWNISWDSFLSIFSNFPNITALTISGYVFGRTPTAASAMATEMVVAPNLQYLRISASAQWLWSLRAPRLKHLAINQDWHFPWGNSFVHDTNPPMFPSLELLALVNCPRDLYDDLQCVTSLAHATRTISQLVIVREYREAEPNYVRHSEVMVKASSLLPLWPSSGVSPSHMFYTAPAYGTHDYLNFPRALRVMRWRKRVLGDGWTMRISSDFAQRWKTDAPELWEVAVAEGLIEPALCNERPHPGDADPCWTYEAGFAAC
ncbi:hypothetical protein HYPSUDRAFT_902051 [Hypholoma sublateritium FD-334 SS-4]|uniref:Uncharacterized protein n=1 Tax=Hypholoma sublateritium (strain FD-334 SS-4) TaxID=945553 RepID=A0A0D2PG40_HYPSF|nr:hypothetical protein HYPSUDRAFT_902051 [Hypholoma sublateritium FD-334 SS-4]